MGSCFTVDDRRKRLEQQFAPSIRRVVGGITQAACTVAAGAAEAGRPGLLFAAGQERESWNGNRMTTRSRMKLHRAWDLRIQWRLPEGNEPVCADLEMAAAEVGTQVDKLRHLAQGISPSVLGEVWRLPCSNPDVETNLDLATDHRTIAPGCETGGRHA